MDNDRLKQLLTQYFDNSIDRDACAELLSYLDQVDPNSIAGTIDDVLNACGPLSTTFRQKQREHIYGKVWENIYRVQQGEAVNGAETARPSAFNFWMRIAAVLVLAIAIAAIVYRYTDALGNGKEEQLAMVEDQRDILLPEGSPAILILADGKAIQIDGTSERLLAQESGVQIRQTKDGYVKYEARGAINEGQLNYHTFRTNKGHSCQLMLPDGTHVWLNTGSSVRYPAVFSGSERHIVLTGEAYFEVAHDVSRPFNVEANGSLIAVLGTHFNVSAFADEDKVTTTLLAGSVHVSKNGHGVRLEPGEQAVVDEQTGEIQQSMANIRSATAWKNGYFRFDNETIESMISKVSRWYDIEGVDYQGQFDDRFTGTFQRSKSVAQLFRHLEELTPIRFGINERRVTVMK